MVAGLIAVWKGPKAAATSVSGGAKHGPGVQLESTQRAKRTIAGSREASSIDQLIETFASTESGYEQKQLAWKRIEEAGEVDSAIAELDRRVVANPRNAEYTAALGIACIKKCARLKDVGEQAPLAMKGDRLLETALNLDPRNWEARFMRAASLSFWPEQMNRQPDVIEQFQILIQQQESEAIRPHFALPYVWLGEQYQKSGDSESAAEIWHRGAALFPNNSELKNKLTSVR